MLLLALRNGQCFHCWYSLPLLSFTTSEQSWLWLVVMSFKLFSWFQCQTFLPYFRMLHLYCRTKSHSSALHVVWHEKCRLVSVSVHLFPPCHYNFINKLLCMSQKKTINRLFERMWKDNFGILSHKMTDKKKIHHPMSIKTNLKNFLSNSLAEKLNCIIIFFSLSPITKECFGGRANLEAKPSTCYIFRTIWLWRSSLTTKPDSNVHF